MSAIKQLVLSSTSPARNALLKRLQIPFITTSPDVDETPRQNESALMLVQRLAEEKARISANKYPDAIIIGSDQVGTLADTILCKPLTFENAVKQLLAVSEKTVRFYTGMCVYDARQDTAQVIVETYDVYFRKLTLEKIEHYLNKENALHCAGSFQAEGLGVTLIQKFSGDDYTALIGLPLIKLSEMLEKAGVILY